MITHTFENLSGEAMPLKDLAVKAVGGGRFSNSSFQLIFFDNTGNPSTVGADDTMKTFCKDAYDNLGDKNLIFCYNSTAKAWYLYDDYSTKAYPMDEYPVVPGRAFNVKVSGFAQGLQTTSSGAVAAEGLDVVIPNGYQLLGNAMPTETKLKDLTVAAVGSGRFSNSSFQLIFFDNTGNPSTIGSDETMKTFCKDAYDNLGTKNLIFCYNSTAKAWYLYDDYSTKAYPMNEYPIAAGRGFNVKVSGFAAGLKITIPSPLADEKAAE